MPPSILSVFGRSPIKPLQKHMAKACDAAQALDDFFQFVLQENWPAAEKQQAVITQLENEADDLKKDLRLHLPSGLFLPIPRPDLLELLTMQDRIANKAKDIAGLVFGRKMIFPTEIKTAMANYIKRSIAAATQARKAIRELNELFEAGFSGKEVEIVEDMIVELDDIEHDTDEMQVSIRQQLFQLEKTLPPVDAMFLYKAVDWIGDLADRAQDAGERLQLLIAR